MIARWKGWILGALGFLGAMLLVFLRGRQSGIAKAATSHERDRIQGEINALEKTASDREVARKAETETAHEQTERELATRLEQPPSDSDADLALAQAKQRWLDTKKK